jgi:hypothetical protein
VIQVIFGEVLRNWNRERQNINEGITEAGESCCHPRAAGTRKKDSNL